MATPAPAQPRPAFYTAGTWTLSRVLCFIAFVCMLIAALAAGNVISSTPALAWAFGGFAAYFLAAAV